MSFENPTPVRIGMRGSFAGKDFSVVGRMVMGVEINGETYYWNEFNLQAKTGEAATLVYEEGAWRLFTEFEPDHPLPATEAVLKQIGDQLNLTGVNVLVTLVSTSQVYRIEGTAPAGEKVGHEENYFNAEAGDVMQVVSWKGQKVEYYNGITLSRGSVEKAFRLPRMAPVKLFSGAGQASNWGTRRFSGGGEQSGAWVWMICIGLFFMLILWENFTFTTTYEAPAVKRISSPTIPLMVGTAGTWDGKKFQITAHAVIEIGGVNSIYERNEYELTDEYGIISLLVCGEKPGVKDWTLYTRLSPLDPPTPQQAATQKTGDTVNIDGVVATISELSQYTVKYVNNIAPSGWLLGDVRFGYAADSEYNSLLVRWDRQHINFWRGKKIAAKDFSASITATNSP
jgi:hypothetical protein